VQAQQALELGPGRLAQVAPAVQPLAGVVAEELLAEAGVDPGAPAGVGLLGRQPGVGVRLGGKGDLGRDPPAAGLVPGPVPLTSLFDAAEDAPTRAPRLAVLGRTGKNDM